MSLKKTVRGRCPDRLILGLFFLYGFHFAYAQETGLFRWSLDGDLRYRFESWDNANALSYGNPPEYGRPDDKILLQRIIAGTTINSGRHLTISAHVQDARAFGWSLANAREPYAFSVSPEGQPEAGYKMNPQEEFFEVHDLYITVGKFWQHLSVTAGRQKIALGDYRIFGPGTWGNTGRWSWDALRFTYSPERWSLNAWVGGTKIHDPVQTSFPFTHTEYLGGGIHSVISLLPRTKLDVMFAFKRQGSAPYIRDQDIKRNWTGLRFYQW